MRISDKFLIMKKSVWKWMSGRSGSEMVEASFVLPVIVLLTVLLLRVFAFYLEILDTQVSSHIEAVEVWDSFNKAYISVYRDTETVSLVRGGLLMQDLDKVISTEAYLLNEDVIIRAGQILNK